MRPANKQTTHANTREQEKIKAAIHNTPLGEELELEVEVELEEDLVEDTLVDGASTTTT